MGYFGSISSISGNVVYPTASSDGDFRLWGKSISNMFASCSWVTESTVINAINWGTVTRPGANANNGFEVWKMNDGLATGSGRNVYVRVDYGMGRSATNTAYGISAGTSCSPSGTLGGTNGGRLGYIGVWTANANPTVGAVYGTPINITSYVSGDPSRINFLLYAGSASFSDIQFHSYLNIERLKDVNGNDIADGFHICLQMANEGTANSSINWCWNVLYTGSAYGAAGLVGPETRYQTISPTIDVTHAGAFYSPQIGMGLHIPIVGSALPPLLGNVATPINSCLTMNTFPLLISGTSHTYLSMKNTGTSAGAGGLMNPLRIDSANVFHSYLAMRYE